LAARAYPIVRRATSLDTIAMLALCVVVYGRGFIGAIGTYAIATQALFLIVVTLATRALSIGLPADQQGVLVLGMCTRNLGAAFAPLFALPEVDERAVIMVALGVPLQILCSFAAAAWLGRRTRSRQDSRVAVEEESHNGVVFR
jgi:BASS family bile acid:Na+ symporter